MITPSGVVAGIDIGFSKTRASSAVCKFWWDRNRIGWKIKRYRSIDSQRETVIREMVGGTRLQAVAFDGPIRGSLDLIDEYRVAERNLTRLLGSKIGKPGQSNAPVGKRLNEETNLCAETILKLVEVAPATHRHRIHERSIVEAFPTSFLGLMIADPAGVTSTRGKRSDLFYKTLVEDGTIRQLLRFLLPDRTIESNLGLVTNHDDRAALVCAITAVGVSAGTYSCVGDIKNGWIVLPPPEFIRPWAHELLSENGKADQSYHESS